MARAFADHAADPAAAPGQALGFWRALFHIGSNAYRPHEAGTVDPALYDAVFSADFQRFVDGRVGPEALRPAGTAR